MKSHARAAVAVAVAGLGALALTASARLARAETDNGGGDRVHHEERILSLDSDIRVGDDGGLRVVETIRVWSEGKQIRHGLERLFPQTYGGPFGSRTEVGFQVEGAQRDDSNEPFSVNRSGRDVAVRIGSSDTTIEPGEHVFRLTYVTDRQLGFFRDHDELYWNAVGNRWRLPIDTASATVTLPDAARGRARGAVAYVGKAGSRERAARAAVEPFGGTFAAGRPLRAGEGMTIVLEWPKGIVLPPAAATRLRWWLRDNHDAAAALFGILVLAVFIRAVRSRLAGPPAGAAAARDDGTPAVSPCLLRYVVSRGFDERSLSVAVMEMADRGCVTIHQSGAHYELERTDRALNSLAPEVQSTARALFDDKPSVELAPVDAARWSAASTALKWDLDQLGRRYVADGRGMALLGMALAYVSVGFTLTIGTSDPHVGVFVGLIFTTLAISLSAVVRRLLRAFGGGDDLAGTKASTFVPLLLFGSGLAFLAIKLGQLLAAESTPLAVALSAGVAFLGHRALRLWRVRTHDGQAMFREAKRVQRSLGPTAARPAPRGAGGHPGGGGGDSDGGGFDRLLPYALALNAVTSWEDSVTQLGSGAFDPSGSPAVLPDRWQTGTYPWLRRDQNWDRDLPRGARPQSLASFTDHLSSMIATTAAPPPGSSAGGSSSGGSSDSSSSGGGGSSDSGGSSGGGGGGGGGGGW